MSIISLMHCPTGKDIYYKFLTVSHFHFLFKTKVEKVKQKLKPFLLFVWWNSKENKELQALGFSASQEPRCPGKNGKFCKRKHRHLPFWVGNMIPLLNVVVCVKPSLCHNRGTGGTGECDWLQCFPISKYFPNKSAYGSNIRDLVLILWVGNQSLE